MPEEPEEPEEDKCITKAIKCLQVHLEHDPEYRETWKAILSMCFQEEYAKGSHLSDREKMNLMMVAEKAADRFINVLITK